VPFKQFTPRPFTAGAVQTYAPNASGVYGISNAREWIYIGETDNIQQILLTHLLDLNTPLMKHQPAGFVFETCTRAERHARQECLVLEYGPACNQRSRTGFATVESSTAR
jgi:hypothetical protein